MKLLLVEDSNNLALNLSDYFESRGHMFDYAADGVTGLNLAVNDNFDAIVLDVMLPGMNGIEFCRQFRQQAHRDTPLIMLTARDTEQDKLTGFEAGADDYLVKPFSMRELEARLLALVRRCQKQVVTRNLVVGELEYNPDTMAITRSAKAISLKPVPRRILVYLMQNTHRVVTRQELEEEIWQESTPDREVLRVHIHAIRSAIDQGHQHKLLQTIHGVGYRLASFDG